MSKSLKPCQLHFAPSPSKASFDPASQRPARRAYILQPGVHIIIIVWHSNRAMLVVYRVAVKGLASELYDNNPGIVNMICDRTNMPLRVAMEF